MSYAKNSENQKNIVGEGTYTVKNVARGKCAAFIKANHLYQYIKGRKRYILQYSSKTIHSSEYNSITKTFKLKKLETIFLKNVLGMVNYVFRSNYKTATLLIPFRLETKQMFGVLACVACQLEALILKQIIIEALDAGKKANPRLKSKCS